MIQISVRHLTSSHKLRDAKIWCLDNFKVGDVNIWYAGYFYFKHEKDAMLFVLKWS